MRWTFRIFFVLFIAWAIFMVSPFAALYDLAKAVERRDVTRIKERVNFPACAYRSRGRLSATIFTRRKAAPRSAIWIGGSPPMRVRRWSTRSSSSSSPPRPSSIFSMTVGRSESRRREHRKRRSRLSLEFGSMQDTVKTFFASESNGFRSLTIPFPGGCRARSAIPCDDAAQRNDLASDRNRIAEGPCART